MSRIGKKPVPLTKGVTASVSGQTISVKGPKGTRQFTATDDVTLTIDGETRRYGPGESYDIPSSVEHGVQVKAGTVAIDVFAEADRYRLKPR